MRSFLPFSGKNRSVFGIKWMILTAFVFIFSAGATAQMAINTTGASPHSSAMLDVTATGKGVLVPRMTFAQRPAAPATGLIIFQTDVIPGFYFYDGAAWQLIGNATNDYWLPNGNDIYYSNGRVAIGLNAPDNNGLYSANYVTGKAAVIGTDQIGSSIFAIGQLGVLSPATQGVPVSLFNVGVLGIKPNAGFNGAGVLGWNNDSQSDNYGGYFIADGTSANTNYGIYSIAKGGSANYAARMQGRMLIESHNGSTGGADSTYNLLRSEVTHTRFVDTRAIDGYSKPQPGYGIGVYGSGGYRGVYGFADGYGYTGSIAGVYGYAYSGTGGTAYGIYGYAAGGDANFAGYFSGDVVVSSDLRVGTSTQATGYALSVNGKIACTEVLVQAFASWPDYVFADNYELMSLQDLEKSIKQNKRLPGLPAASEVEKNGIQIGDIQTRLVEKIEELTLHLIDQNKQITELQQEVKALKAQNEHLSKSSKR